MSSVAQPEKIIVKLMLPSPVVHLIALLLCLILKLHILAGLGHNGGKITFTACHKELI